MQTWPGTWCGHALVRFDYTCKASGSISVIAFGNPLDDSVLRSERHPEVLSKLLDCGESMFYTSPNSGMLVLVR